MMRYLSLALLLVGFATENHLQAHGDIHERIAGLNHVIACNDRDPGLYLKRGELHRVHRDWEAALSDYRRAEDLIPHLLQVHYLRGRMWLEAGRPSLALPELDRFLEQVPDHTDARLTRSRVLERLDDRLQEAVQDLSFVISRTQIPTPELYLERARLLVRRGPEFVDEALRGIDEGIERLGPLVTLEWFAIQVEAGYGRHKSALARIEALPVDLKSQPVWLSRCGDLLQAAGRPGEARKAYLEARSAITRLPQARQATRSMAELALRLEGLLIQLDSQ